jgi:hypothetical protein
MSLLSDDHGSHTTGNGFARSWLTILSHPQWRADKSRRDQAAGEDKQALAELGPAQQMADLKTERPEGQGRKGGQGIFHGNDLRQALAQHASNSTGAHSTNSGTADAHDLNES